ncbi:Uncharacterised protein g11403 [Pycnogonum litorale]
MGKLSITSCANGLHFNDKVKCCDRPASANCLKGNEVMHSFLDQRSNFKLICEEDSEDFESTVYICGDRAGFQFYRSY